MVVVRAETEWISQAEAARLLAVSRQAIGNAISHERLATADCNGRSKLYRPDVLALTRAAVCLLLAWCRQSHFSTKGIEVAN